MDNDEADAEAEDAACAAFLLVLAMTWMSITLTHRCGLDAIALAATSGDCYVDL